VLNQPKIPHRFVVSVLRRYGLKTTEVTFLPSGDANSAVYRVTAGSVRYSLKLRCGDFEEIVATIPAYLHSQGHRPRDGAHARRHRPTMDLFNQLNRAFMGHEASFFGVRAVKIGEKTARFKARDADDRVGLSVRRGLIWRSR